MPTPVGLLPRRVERKLLAGGSRHVAVEVLVEGPAELQLHASHKV